MKRPAQLLLYLIVISFSFSCKKEHMCDCIKGTGSVVTEERSVGYFRDLEVNGNLNVFITQDTFYSVKVEAGKNLIDGISTEVQGQMLVMKNNNRCNFVRSYKVPVNVYVTVDSLKEIIHRGSAQVTSLNTLQSTELIANIWSSGNMDLTVNVVRGWFHLHVNSGDMNVRGTATVSHVYSAGNGFVNAGNLNTDLTYLNSKSTGECFVNVSKEFYPEINWTGNVHYSGNPPLVIPELNGKGQLIKQ